MLCPAWNISEAVMKGQLSDYDPYPVADLCVSSSTTTTLRLPAGDPRFSVLFSSAQGNDALKRGL